MDTVRHMIIEWFQDVFNSTSGKAQFLSILISSCVAIAVLFLNQWLTNRREHKKIVMEKIEHLYLATIDYVDACDQLITDIQMMKYKNKNGYYRNDDSVYLKMTEAVTTIEMLCGLYFPDVEFEANDYSVRKMPIIWAANSGQIARQEVNADDLHKKSREHIEISSNKLKNISKKLMKSKMV